MCMDSDISENSLEKLKKYWSAFFSGLEVRMLETQLDVPSYMDELKINCRAREDTGRVQWL